MTTENGTVVITKQDERNALAKIKKIIEGLGENSYVGTAFDGVFEIAERNIDYDEDGSTKFYVKEYGTTGERERAYEKETAALNEELAQWRDKYERTAQSISELQGACDKIVVEKSEAEKAAGQAIEALKDAQDEIAKLKARLYDFMTKEG